MCVLGIFSFFFHFQKSLVLRGFTADEAHLSLICKYMETQFISMPPSLHVSCWKQVQPENQWRSNNAKSERRKEEGQEEKYNWRWKIKHDSSIAETKNGTFSESSLCLPIDVLAVSVFSILIFIHDYSNKVKTTTVFMRIYKEPSVFVHVP